VATDNDPVLVLVDALAHHPLSTREELRAAGVAADEATLSRAIWRGLIEVHSRGMTMVGPEEVFTVTRLGLTALGRDPDNADLR
jgi:hypothetical protein